MSPNTSPPSLGGYGGPQGPQQLYQGICLSEVDDVGVWGQLPSGGLRRPNLIRVGTGGIDSAGPIALGPDVTLSEYSNTAVNGASVDLRRARGTQSVPLIVANGDRLGEVIFTGYDGATFRSVGAIRGVIDDVPAAVTVPTRIVFLTGPTFTAIERWWMTSAGHLLAASDGLYDIGAAANRPRDVYSYNQFVMGRAATGFPALTFSADTDTGIGRDAADDANTLSVFLGGSELARWTATGLLLGTAAAPDHTLDVRGELAIFGSSASLARIRYRGFYTASPSNPPSDQSDAMIIDTGAATLFRVRYNDAGVMKVGDMPLV